VVALVEERQTNRDDQGASCARLAQASSPA